MPGHPGKMCVVRAMVIVLPVFRMHTSDKGRLGEIKVMSRLVELGWYPFSDLSGKCPVDLLAWKDGKIVSVQVKSCDRQNTSGSYRVSIGRTRANRTENIVHKFDSTSCDYLAVYLMSINKVCFIKSYDITTGRELSIKPWDVEKLSFIS